MFNIRQSTMDTDQMNSESEDDGEGGPMTRNPRGRPRYIFYMFMLKIFGYGI